MLVYAIGDRVVVMSCTHYHHKIEKEVGTVEAVFRRSGANNSYGVKLDNHTNPSSAKGLYWFDSDCIKYEEKEREEIPMFKNFKVATVEFIDNPNSGRYAYALYNEDIVEGDFVVVSTGHHGFALARVLNISSREEDKKEVKCDREVVCRVDFSDFYFRKDAVKKASELKRKMEKQIREAQELALYEALAEKDPTLKGMFDEYKALMESCK